jgi:uncharacterized cupredoxin-like copper-binding protein
MTRTFGGTAICDWLDQMRDDAANPDKFGEVANVKPNKAGQLTKKLPPGDYVMFCNIVQKMSDGMVVNHYARGMHNMFSAG